MNTCNTVIKKKRSADVGVALLGYLGHGVGGGGLEDVGDVFEGGGGFAELVVEEGVPLFQQCLFCIGFLQTLLEYVHGVCYRLVVIAHGAYTGGEQLLDAVVAPDGKCGR